MWTKPPFAELERALADPEHPIGMRMRAAYYLRQEHDDQSDDNDHKRRRVVQVLEQGLQNRLHGSLMRHEFAYVLGQLQNHAAQPVLLQILQDETDCVMVRHECAEALGAILMADNDNNNLVESASSSTTAIDVLQRVEQETKFPELAQTCQIALHAIKWKQNNNNDEPLLVGCACMMAPYSSVDPAPPHPDHEHLPFSTLGDILCGNEDLFERYRAMFSLRNRGGPEAVAQLCRALTTDTTSCLLRHEVAYVLGQMQHGTAIAALETILRRGDKEHAMVRHEAAEALGACMEDPQHWDQVERLLQEFTKDPDIVVRESCLVALDAADYWARPPPTSEDDGANSSSTTTTKAATSSEDPAAVEKTSDLPPKTFAQQKADKPPQANLVNCHFNVQD